MRDPQLYASRLRQIAEKLDCTCGQPEHLDERTFEGQWPIVCLKHETETLAEEWQDCSTWAAEIKLKTWHLLGVEIGEWPWVVARHPEMESFHQNMLVNDVT